MIISMSERIRNQNFHVMLPCSHVGVWNISDLDNQLCFLIQLYLNKY